MSKKKDKEKLDNSISHVSKKVSHTFDWLIEFSKKVVFGSFILYIICTGVIISLLYLHFSNGDSTGFELFITETNTTFKIVVAGYVIKATFENIIKIGGAKYNDMLNIKHKLYKDYLTKEKGIIFDDNNSEDNSIVNSDNDNTDDNELVSAESNDDDNEVVSTESDDDNEEVSENNGYFNAKG